MGRWLYNVSNAFSDLLGYVLFLAPPIPHSPPIAVHSFFGFDNCHPRNLIPVLDVDQTSRGSDNLLSHILSFQQILAESLVNPVTYWTIMCGYKAQDSA
jgi:hypothetical protein